MTNAEIILTEMLVNELNPEEDVVNTFAGWKKAGYVVKKGEKAVFTTKIWKPSKVKEDKLDDNGNTVTQEVKKLLLVPAGFFLQSQVEPMKDTVKFKGE